MPSAEVKALFAIEQAAAGKMKDAKKRVDELTKQIKEAAKKPPIQPKEESKAQQQEAS